MNTGIMLPSEKKSSAQSIAASCIFRQPWWLEALGREGNFGQVSIELDGGNGATLPYVIQKRFGLKILTMPPLSQTAGPLLHGTGTAGKRALAVEKDLCEALINQLPPHDAFNQNFHWSVSNWLPWYWKGFQQSTRYTYRLNDLSNITELWAGLMPNIKSDIKTARDRHQLKVHSDHDIEMFLAINEMSFKRQGRSFPHSRALVRNLDRQCSARNCRKILFAEDPQGRVHAAVYIVWDENTAYYLMSGADPELRNSGATSLLVWSAIEFSSTVSKAFDFEGSMIESVERFFRGFGAQQTPYSHVWRFNSALVRAGYSSLQIIQRIKR